MNRQTSTAFAPASVGNVAVGFDLIGHVIEGPGDRVTARRTDQRCVTIDAIGGVTDDLPFEAARNTAGRAALALLEAMDVNFGVALTLDKGIPLGSGLGGSAASASAAVVAVNQLLAEPLEIADLYPYALIGESVATDSVQGDNVGPQLIGGLALATPERLVPIPVPADLFAAVVHPACRVETRAARHVLDRDYALADIVSQQTHLALVLAGCFTDNLSLIEEGLDDILIEPHRAPLIPGFSDVKQAALNAGALGASISGAGPTVFAWCRGAPTARIAGRAMAEAFEQHGLDSQVIISPVDAPGAHIIDEQ